MGRGETKKCGCCGVVHDSASWAGLKQLGVVGDDYFKVSLADCFCGSSIGIVILDRTSEEE